MLDRAFEDDLLVEQTRDYYAQDTDGNVWYMGEDVKNYEYDDDGNLIDTNSNSTWRAGVNKARPGWAMPAEQIVGQKYFQEHAPLDDALDEGQTYAIEKQLKVGSVVYANVLQVFERTRVEPDAAEFKFYAPGIGLIRAAEDLDENLMNPERVFEQGRPGGDPAAAGAASAWERPRRAGAWRRRRQMTTTLAPMLIRS